MVITGDDSGKNIMTDVVLLTYPASESVFSLEPGNGLDISAGSATMLLPTNKYICNTHIMVAVHTGSH